MFNWEFGSGKSEVQILELPTSDLSIPNWKGSCSPRRIVTPASQNIGVATRGSIPSRPTFLNLEVGGRRWEVRIRIFRFPTSEFPFETARSSIGRTPVSQAGEMSSILIRVTFSNRRSEVGNGKCSNMNLPISDLRIPNWNHAPVCCDGIGNLTFNQVSLDSRVQFPSGVLFVLRNG